MRTAISNVKQADNERCVFSASFIIRKLAIIFNVVRQHDSIVT